MPFLRVLIQGWINSACCHLFLTKTPKLSIVVIHCWCHAAMKRRTQTSFNNLPTLFSVFRPAVRLWVFREIGLRKSIYGALYKENNKWLPLVFWACLWTSWVHRSLKNSESFLIFFLSPFCSYLCSMNRLVLSSWQMMISFTSLLKWKCPKRTSKTFHHFGYLFIHCLI